MRGGKYLNVWRMAELHAKQAPSRVRELEQWGAVFDRTKKGLINQRNFGGHRYPRLAHVGDRTGLELIRSLQDHGVHQGIDFHMECTALHLLKDGERISGVCAYWRETGRFVVFKAKAVIMATGGGGKAWRVTSNSWEYTGDGQAMAYEAGAELMDMEFCQFHPTENGLAPLGARHPSSPRGVRGEGGVLRNSEGKRFMFEYIPERFAQETADTEGEAAKWLQGVEGARRPRRALDARRRRPGHPGRGGGRSRLSARRRLPQHRQSAGCRLHQAQAPVHVPPVQGAGRGRHHQGPDGGRPHAALTSWVASGSTPTPQMAPKVPGLFGLRRSVPRVCTAPTAWVATRCRT